jgi:DNA-binding NarL/FixJ family response regulator
MKPDWIEFIEAVYEPAGDDVSWAKRLTEVGKLVLGDAQFFGMTVVQHNAPCTSLRPLLVLGLPQTRMDVMEGVDTLGPTFIRAMYYPPQIVTTHVEVGAKLPAFERDYMAKFRSGWGCADGLGLCVHPQPGIPLVFFAGYDRVLDLSRQQRRLLTQIALHVETGYRLRRRPESVMAVVSTDGRILHHEPEAPASLMLKLHVARVERARTRRHRKLHDAVDLWRTLVDGRASLVERTEASRRHYLVVENAPATQPIRALSSTEIDVLSYATRGLSGKAIAYALGLSEPIVSTRLASAAAKIGLTTRQELVRIAAMFGRDPRARFEETALTTSEREVLGLLAQGLSNQEIAAIRSRSVRTIANQVAALLRKTSTSSRRALVTRGPHRAD